MGCIIANFMFSAPFKDVRRAVERGSLGNLNPTPWAVMTGNCTGWVTYSYLIQNQFVFWANAPGLILSIWLNMAAAKLQYCDRMAISMRSSFIQLLDTNRQSFVLPKGERRALGGDFDEEGAGEADMENPRTAYAVNTNGVQTFTNLRKMALDVTMQKTEAPAPHEKVVVGVVTIWIAIISLISFLKLDHRQKELIVGITVNINLLFFYGAPLSTIVTVLKTRDSVSIHRLTMLTNTANGAFWTAFGFGTMDYFILVPNGIGVLLGAIQMILCLVVPSRTNNETLSIESGSGEIESQIEVTRSDEETVTATSPATSNGSDASSDSKTIPSLVSS